ncbi:MAG TPA: FHA domain-containing protein [Candidatus Limnocylindrales bacterium]|jgi:pSer/pThr/pTyr-binding forkhead associated (FHA) protein|nr:FHA domain-containing protein [Candidatus Limnocylindrales bacterium]
MPRLVVNPHSAEAWEIQLKPGTNSLGRDAANDWTIADASVSGRHCQILVDDNSVWIKDLGSTNGTFVDRSLITETKLRGGHTIHLGNVELEYYSDEAQALQEGATVAAGPQIEPPGPNLTINTTRRTTRIALPVAHDKPAPSTPRRASSMDTAGNCRFHPKTAGRFFCPKCQHYFCEVCVTSRVVSGIAHKYCRHCGADCQAVQVSFQPKAEKGFFQRLPDAVLYPVRGAGVIVVVVGIVIVTLLKVGRLMLQLGSLRALVSAVLLEVFAGGYLFTYLQTIIHSTIAGDRELPDLPGITNFVDDVVMPFFRLFGLFLCCFIPALGVAIWAGVSQEPFGALAFLVALGFGGIYFPMAFLATAVLDSIAAANPLLVVPSIIKTPVEYLVCLIPLACSSAVQFWGGVLMKFLFPDGWMTHSVGLLLGMLGMLALLSFLSFYLIILSVHLLGLLYLTSKEKLSWLEN